MWRIRPRREKGRIRQICRMVDQRSMVSPSDALM
jgi:hypothetical protein